MGVALKPLGERWLTARFRGVIDAFDHGNDAAFQKPAEVILPWKNWTVRGAISSKLKCCKRLQSGLRSLLPLPQTKMVARLPGWSSSNGWEIPGAWTT
jgi:hypothetical protein